MGIAYPLYPRSVYTIVDKDLYTPPFRLGTYVRDPPVLRARLRPRAPRANEWRGTLKFLVTNSSVCSVALPPCDACEPRVLTRDAGLWAGKPALRVGEAAERLRRRYLYPN